MDPEALETIGDWVRVVGIVGGLLAAATFLLLLVIGVVLFFVRGTHGVRAAPTEDEWFEALPEDTTTAHYR